MRLELESLTVSHAGFRLSGVNAQVEGQRLALLGAWPALLASWSGRATPSGGSSRIDGNEVRAEVIAGRVGIADPDLPAPPAVTLFDWLTLNLRLTGMARKPAQQQARATLQELRLDGYGGYVVDRFPPSTLWIARLALALSTRPHSVVLPPPVWVAETMAIEHDMLGLAQARARVILACEPAQQPELVFEAEAALLLEATAATSLAPRSLFATGSGAYTLLPLARREQLIEQLSRANVVVHNRESEGELWVQMPAGGSTDLLLRAAVEAEAPLLRMTPLFQSRGGEYRAPNVPSP